MPTRTAIGLDIGTCAVRAAQLSFDKHGVTLERFGQVGLPAGAVRDGEVVNAPVVCAAIRELWSQARFSTKRVVIGVAGQRVVVRAVDLPWMPAGELRASLPLHVQDYLPMPVDGCVLDFHALEDAVDHTGARTVRGLLVAAARDMVMTNLEAVRAAGLQATTVDLTSFAVLRSLAGHSTYDGETEALIDVGARVTNIVVHTAGVPRFVRILLVGGQDVTDAVADRLGIGQLEAEAVKQGGHDGVPGPEPMAVAEQAVASTMATFVDEVRGSLEYFAASYAGHPVQRIVLSGGGSRLRHLPDQLAAATGLPVDAGDPMLRLRLGRTELSDDQLTIARAFAAVPVGLALGAA